jgi:hypothetical protein
MRFLGIVLAWSDSTGKRETGVAAIESDGRVIAAGWTVCVAETVAWLKQHAGNEALAFVDAPLLVLNPPRTQRLCEKAGGGSATDAGRSRPTQRTSPPGTSPASRCVACWKCGDGLRRRRDRLRTPGLSSATHTRPSWEHGSSDTTRSGLCTSASHDDYVQLSGVPSEQLRATNSCDASTRYLVRAPRSTCAPARHGEPSGALAARRSSLQAPRRSNRRFARRMDRRPLARASARSLPSARCTRPGVDEHGTRATIIAPGPP